MSKDKDDEKAKASAAKAPELVKLVRDAALAKGGPTTADVQPDDVPGFLVAGWQKAAKAEK